MIVRKMTSISFIFLGCLCLLVCSKDSTAQESSVATEVKGDMTQSKDSKPSKDLSGYVVIGHLKTKDKYITIRKGPDGPLYTVKSKDGKTLAMDLPAEKLYAEFPELKDVLERSIAIDDARLLLRNQKIKAPIDINRK
jgi:hypothetical protein